MSKPHAMISRLEKIAVSKFGSLSAMAIDLGKSAGYFGAYKSSGKPLGGKLLVELRRKYQINPDYIKDCKRPVFLSSFYADENLVDQNLIVRKRDIMIYQVLHKNEYDPKEWDFLCKDIGFSSNLKEIYEVLDLYTNTRILYTQYQFHTRFAKVQL